MTQPDTRTVTREQLAAALHEAEIFENDDMPELFGTCAHKEQADAIFAALPATPDSAGLDVEQLRLREALTPGERVALPDHLLCQCGHAHSSGSDGEDAGCKCHDGHDWEPAS